MATFKCKMCGGNLEIESEATIVTCEYCGSKQTLPRLDDERRVNLYDRANHFRRNNDFEKASNIYEQILNEDTTDAEAYWSLVLCRYGIEYVEDPSTHKRVPTVNCAQFTSIFDDSNYKSALKYADITQKSIFEEEANTINEIQKGILAISQKEDPFDVFICYKETDTNGRRTQDSVIANDLYHQLIQEGFKVFFSRITLEDKIGTAYEPYIFAALNSAKVMVVLGTKPEYFNAVWVKNEWSRFLSIIKTSGGKKILIPAYKDMDPYELPDEFSHLQAQDMSKLGFMQDLIRGIKKILGDADLVSSLSSNYKRKGDAFVGSSASGTNVATLLKRVFMFLEDRNWAEADAYCEKVLDLDPENAQAYLGKLLAEKRFRTKQDILSLREDLNNNNNYQKIIRFGDNTLVSELKDYNLSNLYNLAKDNMDLACSESEYLNTASQFERIKEYKNAKKLAEQCFENAEICRKNVIYKNGIIKADSFYKEDLNEAISLFQSISGWKDSDNRIIECKKKIENIEIEEDKNRINELKRKKHISILKISIAVGIVLLLLYFSLYISIIRPRRIYNQAIELINSGSYEEGYDILNKLDKWNEVIENKRQRAMILLDQQQYEEAYALLEDICDDETIKANKNERAEILLRNGEYEEAYKLFSQLGNWKTIYESKIERANDLLLQENFEEAYKLFKQIGANEYIKKSYKDRAEKLLEKEKYDEAYALLDEAGEQEAIILSKRYRAFALMESEDYDNAYVLLEEIGDVDNIKNSKYERALSMIDNNDYESAYILLNGLDYKDSEEKLFAVKNKIILNAEIGEHIYWGQYEQDNDTSNGKEDIEWLVLDKQSDKILVISRYALDCQPYHDNYIEKEIVTWENSYLRRWLNGTFLNSTFSSDEKKVIETCEVPIDNNYVSEKSYQGRNTYDKIFLLSLSETQEYLQPYDFIKCYGTYYCNCKYLSLCNKGLGKDIIDEYYYIKDGYIYLRSETDDGNCIENRTKIISYRDWWSRTSGEYEYYEGYSYNGYTTMEYVIGSDINEDFFSGFSGCIYYSIRPAMWVKINS